MTRFHCEYLFSCLRTIQTGGRGRVLNRINSETIVPGCKFVPCSTLGILSPTRRITDAINKDPPSNPFNFFLSSYYFTPIDLHDLNFGRFSLASYLKIKKKIPRSLLPASEIFTNNTHSR